MSSRWLVELLVAVLGLHSVVSQRAYEPDLLDPVFLMAALASEGRYGPPTHPMTRSEGSTKITQLQNPKVAGPPDVAHTVDDVLSVFPTALHPALVSCEILLWPANYGPNRLRVFVRVSQEECTSFTRVNASNHTSTWVECEPAYDQPRVVIAWLANLSSPASAVKNLTMRTVGRPSLELYPGEWLDVVCDFELLPSEYGTGDDRLALYVQLGDRMARHGHAFMTGVRLSPLLEQRRNEVENIAWLKPLTGKSRGCRSDWHACMCRP